MIRKLFKRLLRSIVLEIVDDRDREELMATCMEGTRRD